MNQETEAQVLLMLGEIRSDIKTIKENHVEDKELIQKHERAYQRGKILGVPAIMGIHLALKHLFGRL